MKARWFLPWLLCLALAVPCLAGERVTLYFFSSKSCVNCLHEAEFLAGLQKRIPELQVRTFEVVSDPDNARLLVQVAEAFGVQARGVPVSFIGPFAPIMGYEGDQTTGRLIEERVRGCLARGCEDVVGPLVGRTAPLPAAAGGTAALKSRQAAHPTRSWRCPFSAGRISGRCRCSR